MLVGPSVDAHDRGGRNAQQVERLGREHGTFSVGIHALDAYMRKLSTPTMPPPEVPYSALLGHVLKQHRLLRQIDQQSMAAALGLSQSAYSRIESGDTSVSAWQLRVCASQLGLRSSQLLGEVEAHESRLATQGVAVVAEKKANPTAVLLGLALLAALVSR